MELPADHHCPWRELAESMEQRFTAIITQQQKLIEEQQAVIRKLTDDHDARVLVLETEVAKEEPSGVHTMIGGGVRLVEERCVKKNRPGYTP